LGADDPLYGGASPRVTPTGTRMIPQAPGHESGRHPMHTRYRVFLVVAVAVCVWMTPLVVATGDPAEPPRRAALGPPPATPPPSHVWDQQGHIGLLRVRALVPEQVTVSDPAQGPVRATVLAMDEQLNQVTIQTHAGQRFILFLAPASFTGLCVGQQFLLQVAQRSAP